jgi:hypothetical protein
MSCHSCKYWNECQTQFIVYADTAPINRKTMHCINWTPDDIYEKLPGFTGQPIKKTIWEDKEPYSHAGGKIIYGS